MELVAAMGKKKFNGRPRGRRRSTMEEGAYGMQVGKEREGGTPLFAEARCRIGEPHQHAASVEATTTERKVELTRRREGSKTTALTSEKGREKGSRG